MQINSVRLSQPQNKPAFAGKAVIITSNPQKMHREITAILDATPLAKGMQSFIPTPGSLAFFAPDSHIAGVMRTLACNGRLKETPAEVLSKLLQSGGEKLAVFTEKVAEKLGK